MKYLFLLTIIGIILALSTITVEAQDDFSLTGNPETGWVFLTPKFDYYAQWFDEELYAIWIDRETKVADCLIVREGKIEDCALEEFSIILHYYPHEEIKRLREL